MLSVLTLKETFFMKPPFSPYDLTRKPKTIILPKQSGNLELKYDRLNRPISLSYNCYKENQIKYDKVGQPTSKQINGDLQIFEHDHLQQLTLEKTSQYSHKYENDALNRQILVDGKKQKHNAINQLVHGINGKYTYDQKGRRIQASNTHYTYDSFDRLIAIKQGSSSWSYTYDAFNRKMSRKSGEKEIFYLYNGYEEIGSYNQDNECIDLKILSAGEDSIPIGIEIGDQQYSPLISSQRHIVGLIEIESGNLADSSPLTLFGKDLLENPLSPWRFCRKRHEEARLGIIDFGFRFYDPQSAQWLTRDPLGEADGPNLYAYVKNSPTVLMDKFGLYSFSEGWDDFKEGFNQAWDNIKESFNSAWDNVKDSFNGWGAANDSFGNNSSDLNYGEHLSIGGGISHGVVDFCFQSLHDLHTCCAYMGASALEMNLHEMIGVIEAGDQMHANQMRQVESSMMDLFSVNESDALYQTYRSNTTLGLNVASLVSGGAAAIKGLMAFNRLGRAPLQITKLTEFSTSKITNSNGFLGCRGYQLKNSFSGKNINSPLVIQGRSYGSHALDQMQNRGFTPSVVEDVIRNGIKSPNKRAGRIQSYDPINDITVITENGKVITVSYGEL